MIRRAFGALVCCFLATAFAATASDQDWITTVETASTEGPWQQIRTENFELLSNGDPAFARELAESLEQLREVLERLAPSAVAKTRAVPRIFLFQDRASFARFSPGTATGPTGGLGYLFPRSDRYYAGVLGNPAANPQAILYKQYIHQVLLDNLPSLPEWFRHGLAEFYSTFSLEGDKAVIGRPVQGHLLHLRGSLPLSLAQLRAGQAGLFSASDRRLFAPRSWLVVHYLLSTSQERHRETLRFLRQMAAGTDPDTAFREAFGTSDTSLEAEILEYREQPRFQHLIVTLPPLDETEVEVRPLAEHEVETFLGDLLAHLGPERHDEAETLLRQAIALEPEHGPAWYALGYLARETGEHEVAAGHLEKAIQWDPESYPAHFAYGDSLLQLLGGRRPEAEEDLARLEEAKAALRRAVKLDQDSADAWNRLGFAFGLDPEPSQEGVDALQKALRLAPGSTDVMLNLLLAHARMGDTVRVDDMWQGLLTLEADPSTLAKAREVRLQLRFNQANRLIRENRFADAAGLFAQVRSETTNPALAQLAAERFEQISAIAQYNRFAQLYQAAKDALVQGKTAEAGPILQELLEVARPGLQKEVAQELATRGLG